MLQNSLNMYSICFFSLSIENILKAVTEIEGLLHYQVPGGDKCEVSTFYFLVSTLSLVSHAF